MNRRLVLAAAILLLVAGAACAKSFPDDPYYSYEWYAPLLGLPKAWNYTLGSPDVVVAVLDTGVMADTPDLQGRLLPPIAAEGLPVLDGTTHHHGTWVASTLAMTIDNLIGGAGLGNFKVLPVTVTAPDGSNVSEDVASGIYKAADAGARVINISHSVWDYAVLDTAAAYARGKGAITFIAAGNSDMYVDMTGYPNLIFVSATDSMDQRWSEAKSDGTRIGSSYGPYVDLAAPGDNILVADPQPPTDMDRYGLVHGTSFAAPMAAGAAALAWSIRPDLTADQVLALLCSTAKDLGPLGRDDEFGYGRIDVGAMVDALTPEPATLALLAAGLAAVVIGRRQPRQAAL
jgi:subtilisin family serine protease